MRMRLLRPELALGVAFVVLGILLFLSGVSILTIWVGTLRCPLGANCVVRIIYSPGLPWPLLLTYVALSVLAAFGGWWTFRERRRRGPTETQGEARWLAVMGLLSALFAWSAALVVMTLQYGPVLLLVGGASSPGLVVFYALLVAMPLVAIGIGSGLAARGVRRSPAPRA